VTDARMNFSGRPHGCRHIGALSMTEPNLNLYHVTRVPSLIIGETTTVFGLTRNDALKKVEDLKANGVEAEAVQTATGITIAGRGKVGNPNGKTARRRARATQ
jgi:hypothetical protein